jgi:hypothetical protein
MLKRSWLLVCVGALTACGGTHAPAQVDGNADSGTDSESEASPDAPYDGPCFEAGQPCDPSDLKRFTVKNCCSHGCDQNLATGMTTCL